VGPQLAAALAILAVGAWTFGATAEELLEGDTAYDERLAAWLHERATDPVTEVAEAVTFLGNIPTLVAVTLLAAGLLLRRGDRREAAFVLLGFAGAQVLLVAMKLGFRRERPFFADPLATESTYSFPSGHALVSLAVYGAVALVVVSRLEARRAQALVLACAAALVLAIGSSRLYLGVHFLSDVLAGLAAGAAWLAALWIALHLRDRRRARAQRMSTIGL
jgi:undecaprenyl-diphosphatase